MVACGLALASCGSAASGQRSAATGHPQSRRPLVGQAHFAADRSDPIAVTSRRLGRSVAGGTAIPVTSIYGSPSFASRRVEFALARYPARSHSLVPVLTLSAGHRWRIIGPTLSAPSADGGIGVSLVGVAGTRTYFAWQGGTNGTLDITTDAGKVWRQVLFQGGTVESVTPDLDERGLDGRVEVLVSTGTSCPAGGPCQLAHYTSRDGTHWRRLSG
jgi:hypothetical protein